MTLMTVLCQARICQCEISIVLLHEIVLSPEGARIRCVWRKTACSAHGRKCHRSTKILHRDTLVVDGEEGELILFAYTDNKLHRTVAPAVPITVDCAIVEKGRRSYGCFS